MQSLAFIGQKNIICQKYLAKKNKKKNQIKNKRQKKKNKMHLWKLANYRWEMAQPYKTSRLRLRLWTMDCFRNLGH